MLKAKEWEVGVWSFSSLAMKGTAGQGGRVRGLSFWIMKPFGTKVRRDRLRQGDNQCSKHG